MQGKGKLKIYSDREFVSSGKEMEAMLWPFLGKEPENPTNPNTGRYDKYMDAALGVFEVTDIGHCDLAVLPVAWDAKDELQQKFIALAQRYNKPIVLFFNYDSTEDIPVPNSFIFRTSFYQSKKRPNEFAQPAWSEDFTERYFGGNLPIRQKTSRPTVSYCGYGSNWKTRIKKILGRPIHPGERIRGQAMNILSKDPSIQTNFIIRKGFWGGIYKHVKPGEVPADIMKIRREYVENMAAGDYVLCSRGGGNFSYRFYEALSLGRIPVFVNTDCVLPYEQFIDYKNLIVWVEEYELDKITEKIIAYHNSLTPNQFIERQRQLRQIWEEWLSPQGFFKNLYKIVKP